MALWNLRLVGDLPKRQPATLARAAEELTKRDAIARLREGWSIGVATQLGERIHKVFPYLADRAREDPGVKESVIRVGPCAPAIATCRFAQGREKACF